MDSDSDTLSAADSDVNDYMDGVRIRSEDSENEDEALDTLNTCGTTVKNADVKKKDRLTHMQKIKAQRRISSTPLHDYMNPSRILDPEHIRGKLPSDNTLDAIGKSSSPVLSHHNTNESIHETGNTPSVSSDASDILNKSPSRVRFGGVKDEDTNVFFDLSTVKEKEEEEDDSGDQINKTFNNVENMESPTKYIGQKQRKCALVGNPYMNSIHSQGEINVFQLDVQHDNAVGETIESRGIEEAKQSLRRLALQDKGPRIISDSSCRNWSNSSEEDKKNAGVEGTSTLDENTEANIQIPGNRSNPEHNKLGKDLLSVHKWPVDLDSTSCSSSDPETEHTDQDHREGYKVIQFRPRTFTDTSTEDEEIRQNVKKRIDGMNKSGRESET